jgi:hypothetical protein
MDELLIIVYSESQSMLFDTWLWSSLEIINSYEFLIRFLHFLVSSWTFRLLLWL